VKNWGSRTREVAHLLNPAFCARLLYGTISTYNIETQHGFPFPLIYLILPLLLHKHTREKISSRTQLLVWIQRNEKLLVTFAERAKQLVPITNEALEWLMQCEIIIIGTAAELEVVHAKQSLSKTAFADDEMKSCINKSEHVAKWFAKAGKVETIFYGLGVRP